MSSLFVNDGDVDKKHDKKKKYEENTTQDSSSFNTPSFWDDLAYKKQSDNYIMPPTCFSLQRFVLYETKTRFYLVGSNRTKNRFKVLKIDRTYEDEVVISEDPTDYNKQQIQDLLTMIGNANKEGLTRVCSSYGILGFIRFLHGYYIILITEKRKVGMIGTHFIYGIDDITYVYIPPSFPKTNSPEFADETRYKGLFLSLDLTKDFYFSYTYDITRTLQFNMTRYFHHPIPKNIGKDEQSSSSSSSQSPLNGNNNNSSGSNGPPKLYYNDQFTWNQFLLEPLVEQAKTWYWVLPIIHGYFVQDKIDIFGKGLDLILIARRSRYYAGARFLKRGINENGQVANDVETEQILQEPATGISSVARFSSFVQIRGSIPLYWEQDNNIMTPKPPIKIQRMDPFLGSTILHFQDLLKRFGSPTIILNLVKSNEKKPRESILRNEFTECIETLNEMLPEKHKIQYQAWDFHQAAKSKDQDHMAWLDSFANQSILKTGIFYSNSKLYCNFLRENYSSSGSSSSSSSDDSGGGGGGNNIDENYKFDLFNEIGTEQIGVVRTNCIDSLDRTNAAQFCIGKCALGYQLYSMGLLDSPSLDFNTGIVQVLIDMYEACGNQIALQYGGSELANTIKTYTKHSLSSQSRDLVNAIKRYISNSFIDADKQHSINLFLGYYVPAKSTEKIPLWNLETDHYLHNITSRKQHYLLAYTNWWQESLNCFKKSSLLFNLIHKSSMIEMMKAKSLYEFEDTFYKIDRLTLFEKHFSYRFSDPIRFRNQSSPLSITIENPNQNLNTPYLLPKQQQQQQFEQQIIYVNQNLINSTTTTTTGVTSNQQGFKNYNNSFKNLNNGGGEIENVSGDFEDSPSSSDITSINEDESKRYDIKRWVVSLSKRNNNTIFKKEDKEAMALAAEAKRKKKQHLYPKNKLQLHQKGGNDQPLKHFGIQLGTTNFDLEIFDQYINYPHLVSPLEYSSQDQYSIKYYKEYLKNSNEKEKSKSKPYSSLLSGGSGIDNNESNNNNSTTTSSPMSHQYIHSTHTSLIDKLIYDQEIQKQKELLLVQQQLINGSQPLQHVISSNNDSFEIISSVPISPPQPVYNDTEKYKYQYKPEQKTLKDNQSHQSYHYHHSKHNTSTINNNTTPSSPPSTPKLPQLSLESNPPPNVNVLRSTTNTIKYNNNNNNNNNNTNNYVNRNTISSSVGGTGFSTPKKPQLISSSSATNVHHHNNNNNHHNQPSSSQFQEITKQDLKSFYYQSYLTNHNCNTLYSIPPNNLDLYSTIISLKNLDLNHSTTTTTISDNINNKIYK